TPLSLPPPKAQQSLHLSRFRRDLGWCTLGTLFALNSTGLAPCCTRRSLRFLSPLLALRSRLFLLAFLDRSLPGCGSGFRTHISSFLDHIKRRAHDSTLMFDSAAGALLGYFL